MVNAQHVREPAMVPHCLMCGSLVGTGEGIVSWSLGFPFLFCSRECQDDYQAVNAKRFSRREGRSWLERNQGNLAVAVH